MASDITIKLERPAPHDGGMDTAAGGKTQVKVMKWNGDFAPPAGAVKVPNSSLLCDWTDPADYQKAVDAAAGAATPATDAQTAAKVLSPVEAAKQ